MSVLQVKVRAVVSGAYRSGMPDVLVELASERATVRELIRRAVEEQIRSLGVDATRCQTVLDRQYLSAAEIRAQASTGMVRMPSPQLDSPDVAEHVARACRAFERSVFVLFVGGRQVERLDEEIVLRPGEPVVFLRLTALVGG
ncbi:hypothetical protein OG470_31455 [Micromonospora sp. NBC_00389]|uniref:hypothetical protein n=1 Tax=Micromonospora sp. NBC_00389 TaxID=2903586 RepID=UPI002E1E5CAF